MAIDIVRTSTRNIDDVRNINCDLIEKSLQMRCLAYLSQVKAQLLTETIFEVDNSKKGLKLLNADLSRQHEIISRQKQDLQVQLQELKTTRGKLEAANQELEDKNRQLEKLNKLFVDREFRIKELKDKLAQLERCKC